jgi:type II secretory pathway predicted ATPase ExeA
MYKNFFGLRENPFNINPDPRFLYLTPQIREALDLLTYGVQNRKGCILLTGEVGTGKTTLINCLLEWLRQRKMPTAFIFNSHLSVTHLLDFILTDFGVQIDFRLKGNMILQLTKWLLERFRAGETPVLILDEAQGLSFELLEEVRLLLNLETASEKLLQIVLVGQPELEEKLKHPKMRQLRQRIALRCNTAPLTLEESRGYIAERLRIGGATGDSVFASDAVEALHFYSRGIPRVMNLLCEHALINAYVEQLNPVPAPMVEETARDFLMEEFRPITACSGANNPMDSKFGIMQPAVAAEFVRPVKNQAAPSHEAHDAKWPPAPAAFAVAGHALSVETGFVTTVPKCEESAASGENLAPSLPVDYFLTVLPGLKRRPGKREVSLESISSESDSTAEHIATMKRMLAAASSVPSHQLQIHTVRKEPSSAPNLTQTAASMNRVFSFDGMNPTHHGSSRASFRGLQPSLKAWCSSWRTSFPWTVSTAMWSRLSLSVVPMIRESIHTARKLLRRWTSEFRRDWMAMVNAIAFAQIRKFFLHWWRQPLSSKTLESRKN